MALERIQMIFSLGFMLLLFASIKVHCNVVQQNEREREGNLSKAIITETNPVSDHFLSDQFCRNVSFRCSQVRQDEQYLPYFDSRCYCDMFCFTEGYDCCPDFEEACMSRNLSDFASQTQVNVEVDDEKQRSMVAEWFVSANSLKPNIQRESVFNYTDLNTNRIPLLPYDTEAITDKIWFDEQHERTPFQTANISHPMVISVVKKSESNLSNQSITNHIWEHRLFDKYNQQVEMPVQIFDEDAPNQTTEGHILSELGSINTDAIRDGQYGISSEEMLNQRSESSTINNRELLEQINSNNLSWTAKSYPMWDDENLTDLLDKLFGSETCNGLLENIHQIETYEHDWNDIMQFTPPNDWDLRETSTAWPLGPIQDQQKTPIAWAISALDVVADRFARLSHINKIWNRTGQPFSLMHLIDCTKPKLINPLGNPCGLQRNGSIATAWHFLRSVGTVTENCYPTDFHSIKTPVIAGNRSSAQCKLLMKSGIKKSLKVGIQIVRMRCPRKGIITNKGKYSLYFKSGHPYHLPAGEDRQIQYEIYARGPVQAVILVCPDFLLYASGIYSNQHSNWYADEQRSKCRYHAVRIIGWGHALDQNNNVRLYWICANSWGVSWGENGFFKIFSNESEVNKWVFTMFGHGEFYPTII